MDRLPFAPAFAPPIPADIESHDASGVLRAALAAIGTARLPFVTGFGAEGIVILDLLTRIEPHPRVLTLDTGRLPDETHELMDRVRERFGVHVEVILPDADDVETMVRERGANLFYRSREDRVRCCDVRKVRPLSRALDGAGGWVTGLRRDQSASRAGTPKIAPDLANRLIWKVAPLADWSSEQVWAYIREHELPHNELHDKGYLSIGCAPCTRPVRAGEDERAGRWWWEASDDPRECGIHNGQTTAVGAG